MHLTLRPSHLTLPYDHHTLPYDHHTLPYDHHTFYLQSDSVGVWPLATALRLPWFTCHVLRPGTVRVRCAPRVACSHCRWVCAPAVHAAIQTGVPSWSTLEHGEHHGRTRTYHLRATMLRVPILMLAYALTTSVQLCYVCPYSCSHTTIHPLVYDGCSAKCRSTSFLRPVPTSLQRSPTA